VPVSFFVPNIKCFMIRHLLTSSRTLPSFCSCIQFIKCFIRWHLLTWTRTPESKKN
jgi:hypothetical protein